MQKTIVKIGEYLFYLFAFLLPWQTRWIFNDQMLNGAFWEYGSFSLYAFDALLILLFIISLIIAQKKNLKINASIFALLIFILVGFLSMYWALDKDIALYYFIRLFACLAILFIVLQIKFQPIYLAISIATAGIVQSCLAAYQFFTQGVFANKWLGMAYHGAHILGDQVVEYSDARFLRAYGAMPHPNILAGFLGVSIILSFGIYLGANKNWQKYFALASIVINSAGLFFTFSRSAWLGLAVALLFFGLLTFWIYHTRELSFIKLTTALLLPFILLSIIYPNLVLTRFGFSERLETKSIDQRAELQSQSLEIIKDTWPTGVGLGNYTKAVHDKIDKNLETYEYQPVHNIYLLILAELGIFGLIFFIFILLSIFRRLDYKNKLNLSFGICFIFFAFIGFFDHYLWTMTSGLFLFFILFSINIKNNLFSGT
ncbi:MAG: O-antigen ligase family protein [Patescibacteria group bacterium]|nr:O-antigen ligase family protein [Patescibacteria group bacterium]